MSNEPYISSNSEIGTFQKCKRKHYYSFALGLRSKTKGRALGFGVLGHSVWETFYRAQLEGETWDSAYDIASQHLFREIARDKYTNEAVEMVSGRFAAYTEFWRREPFTVLGVEDTYMVEIDADNTFAFTVDLLVEYFAGPFKGEVVPIDYKWTYNFWGDMELKMHPQFPKYIWGLRHLGYPTRRAMLDQIRYREDAVEWFKRTPWDPTEIMQDNIMEIHREVANSIAPLIRQPVKEYAKLAKQTLDRRECNFCDFNDLCYQELNGKDPSKTMTANFIPTDYGYRHDGAA